MSKIILDYKKIDFSMAALTLFCPNGKTISIEKIEGKDLHPEYLDIIRKNDKEIKRLLTKIDMKYYIINPADFLNDIITLLVKNNYSIYMNLGLNLPSPTYCAMLFFPEDIPKNTKTILNNIKDNFSKIIFYEIAKLNNESKFFETYLTDEFADEPNSEELFKIINKPNTNIRTK